MSNTKQIYPVDINKVTVCRPTYRHNFKKGYVGFSFNDKSFISKGIVFFTSKPEIKIKVSHTFFVLNDEDGIEATLTKRVNGVHRFKLKKYFNDPFIHVLFKKPVDMDAQAIETYLRYASTKIRSKYDYFAFGGFITRWILRPLENMKWLRKKPSLFNAPKKYYCSELISEALGQVERYAKLIPLINYHPSKIHPQLLFNSTELWEKWSYEK